LRSVLKCAEGHGEAAVTLVRLGADVAARDANGCTPLHWAAGQEDVGMLVTLVRLGADKEAAGAHGGRPLHLAVLWCV
jgi:ankyrin repeat protein